MKIQSQIRQNAEEMSSFYNDLSKWEATAAKRDKAIKDSKKKKPPRQFASNSPLVVSGESYSKSVEAMQSGPSTNPVENGQSEILTPASLVAQHSIPIVAPSTVPKASGELSTESMETKVRELGNAEYLKGNFEQAIKLYTKCIGLKVSA